MIRVIHPGVPLDRYLIEVGTARVFNLKKSRWYHRATRPMWLFSSLYWPLPKGICIRRDSKSGVGPGKMLVSLPWHRTHVSLRRRKNAFTIYGAGPPVHCASEADARGVMARRKAKTTEAVIAVSGPLCRVGMFLGVHRSSVALLKAFTGPLIDASRCRTAPT
jgi:hypothetical protein